MGVITTKKSLVQLEKLSTASFCRRRLSVVMVRLKMAQTLREAVTFIEQVGPFRIIRTLNNTVCLCERAPSVCCSEQAGSYTSTGTPESAVPLREKLSCAVRSPTLLSHHEPSASTLQDAAVWCSWHLRAGAMSIQDVHMSHIQVACTAQGHVRIGPETVTEPAFLVTRSMEDFVTWVDTSKIKRKISAYNEQLDDFDLLNA